ncbi:MAG: putative glycosyltransferase [Solirubrobacterales bacterium]|nr:putative glycosyltransferase [Solirubrobacterales bacterium]
MARPTVLLCTEGTYPYVGGGVSTWCDILCRELEDYDFTLYAVTGEPEVRLRYELPPNVTRTVHIPLWGAREPSDFVLAAVPFSELDARRRRTTAKALEQRFVPMLHRLLAAMTTEASHEDDGTLIWELWRWFQEHDWRATWKSREVWEAFLEITAVSHGALQPPTLEDTFTALRWLSNYLLPLTAPVPRTDIVHTTIAGFPGLAGIVSKFEYGTPYLVTEHGVWVRERYISISSGPFSDYGKRFLMGLSRYLARVNYRVADVVSPVTGFNRRWELPYGAPDERIETIPNGIDPGLFMPGPKPASTAGRPVVVAAARVFPLKDIHTMIRSAEVARRELPDVQFLIYGSLDADVPYVESCRALIAELGLEETFVFAGHHTKPADLYNEGDISALSSISEGFPYTVLESMACARPVVATDVGGVREALEDFGILVPPRDHEAFGRAVVTLLRNPELRGRMGRQAREAVLARFRIAHSVGAYRELYERLMAQPPAPTLAEAA